MQDTRMACDAGISWKRLLCLTLAVFVAYNLLGFSAYASGTATPMGNVLCNVVDFMLGNLGRGLATLAVIVVGVGAMLGKVSWGLAITVAVGISVIFNADSIVTKLGVSSTASC